MYIGWPSITASASMPPTLFPIPERGLAERLYRVTAKTVLVWGESDRMIPLPYAEAFRRHLPHATLVRIPQAGHMAPYEQTDAVVEAIEGTL
jgi:pimeloyl-ACP methyl ester carboxylesterase